LCLSRVPPVWERDGKPSASSEISRTSPELKYEYAPGHHEHRLHLGIELAIHQGHLQLVFVVADGADSSQDDFSSLRFAYSTSKPSKASTRTLLHFLVSCAHRQSLSTEKSGVLAEFGERTMSTSKFLTRAQPGQMAFVEDRSSPGRWRLLAFSKRLILGEAMKC